MLLEAWYRLKSMAFDRKGCEAHITHLSGPILDHLIKVLRYDDPVNYHKHIDDIDTWLSEVHEVKPSKCFKLKERDYYTWLWGETKMANLSSTFTGKLDLLDRKYGELPKLRSNEEVKIILPLIYRSLAKTLSADRYPSIEDAILKARRS